MPRFIDHFSSVAAVRFVTRFTVKLEASICSCHSSLTLRLNFFASSDNHRFQKNCTDSSIVAIAVRFSSNRKYDVSFVRRSITQSHGTIVIDKFGSVNYIWICTKNSYRSSSLSIIHKLWEGVASSKIRREIRIFATSKRRRSEVYHGKGNGTLEVASACF